MQIPLLHQQLILQTERLRDLHRSIMQHESPVPAAEIETLLQEIRNLYSTALHINQENALQLLQEVQLAVTESLKNQIKEIPEPTFETPLAQTVTTNAGVQSHPGQARPSSTQAPLSAKHPEPEAAEKKSESDNRKKITDTPVVASKYNEQKTIAERIAGSESKKRLGDNLKSSVKDMKAAIGLNEKFQFINTLFQGDTTEYNASVDRLNTSNSSEEAMRLIKEIAAKQKWESNSESAKQFIEFVERRFSA